MKRLLPLFFGMALFLASCSDDDSVIDGGVNGDGQEVNLNEPINDFVWKAMNSWYNWQKESQNLDDTKDDIKNDYYTFLNSYNDAEDFMYQLCYKHWSVVGDGNAVDRFSWFIEDYEVQEKAFQGITTSFGIRYQPVQVTNDGDVILYLEFVSPDSPAFKAGMKRGDLISGLNGTSINTSNYSSVMSSLSDNTVTFSIAAIEGNSLKELDSKTITRAVVADNPVHFYKVFEDVGGKKVGYLVYNGFRFSYNDELNEAFAFFKSEGINELVLDLRLNGGGSVETTAFLASMIYADAGTDIFAELIFNSKHSGSNGAYNFSNTLNKYNAEGDSEGQEPINRLSSIDRLYVLASGGTASASEMIINGLKPFIPVKVIGTRTYGKNVGSITLYDSPGTDFRAKSTNQSHKNAMQPIVFQIFNKSGESDYTQGFAPDIEVKEWQYWDNILPFGDENEIVLKSALDDIRGFAAKPESIKRRTDALKLDFDDPEQKFEKEMYIHANFFELP
ncbi:peptidase S41 [Lutimonas saemankumensis]|uniref:S41 family peptidase n=1 Tax=Lutimonas saemankumensis TaxID=483016 RepID=UPI001CD7CCAC|nr:S41 family peptidase [Lutimonas saemankumensis]MCA0931835.1 peptidase S41 [Lutimonas saemankumensis]